MIVDNLENKSVAPQVKDIIVKIKNNFGIIKEEVLDNKIDSIESIVSNAIAC